MEIPKQETQKNYGEVNNNTEEADQNLRSLANNEIPVKKKGATKKLAIRGIKAVGKGMYKGVRKVAPAIPGVIAGGVGTGMGFAIGVATGKPSNAFQYAATGAGIGAALGTGVTNTGINLARGVRQEVPKKLDQMAIAADEERFGKEYAREQQIARENSRARKRFLENESEKEKYEEMMGKIGYKGSRKDFMNAAFDLKEAGVSSDNMIKNALKLEMQRDDGEVGGKSHENVMDVASFAEKNGYTKDYIEDTKKREAMEGVVQSMISNADQQRAVMETFAGLHGRTEFYKKHSGLNQASSNNNTGNANQTGTQSTTPRIANNPGNMSRGRPKNS